MSDALAFYREAREATETLAREKVFDLRTRVARVDDAMHLLSVESTRCRLSESNRRRATVPSDDLQAAIHYLKNHRTQLELAEKKAIQAAA